MKCPVCQNEIEEGQLYCGKCGYEIQIVPDFEAELENNIIENMSDIISDLLPDEETGNMQDEEEIDEDLPDDEEAYEDVQDEERPNIYAIVFGFLKKHRKFTVVVIVALILLVSGFTYRHFREKMRNTYGYQYQKALESAGAGDYEAAIDYLQEALRLESNHPEARMLTADYKVKIGETSEAELIYKDLFNYADYVEEAYEKYIAILESEERYLEICNELEKCEIQSVLRNYNQYLAEPPIFSVQEGTYDDVQMLKISANTNGIIYYTMDGTEPNEAGNVYTGPILLESGAYEISAIFINEYGKRSSIFSAEYMINAEIPNMPIVTPDGGDYQVPEYISVEVPQGCTVYYTMDGSVPDENSLTYSREICMPLENATFRFVSYSNDHVASEINQVEYHLNLDSPRFSAYQAMLITASGLENYGILLNMSGEVAGASGTYSYKATAAFVYGEEVYYLMTEYYTDTSGNTYSTQTKYAVSVAYGILYKTNIDQNGHYTVVAFE